jgi:hypothetical protein
MVFHIPCSKAPLAADNLIPVIPIIHRQIPLVRITHRGEWASRRVAQWKERSGF